MTATAVVEPTLDETGHVRPLLAAHFEGRPLEQLSVTERKFPDRIRIDLHAALDGFLAGAATHLFCGVRKQHAMQGIGFTDLTAHDRQDPPTVVAPLYDEIDVGDAEPARCLKGGLWLLSEGGLRFAVLLSPPTYFDREPGVCFQVAAPPGEAGVRITQRFFKRLEEAAQEARSYRGKVLSLEHEEGYRGARSGIKVHKLRSVGRDQVILSSKTLELLDRNVIDFVKRRPQLSRLGLSTKKGLLFYGPPGTGKTHTIHYLAGALPGLTTLLITAEQVAQLSEYMTLARLLQPSMIVIEDADLIARERSEMNSPCEEVLLNKLLNEMDGLREDADVLFVLTTNRPEGLEAALASRPGRIDQAIEFPYPDADGRRKLVHLYSRGVTLAEGVVTGTVRRTEKVSAAFIKELMRRAAQFKLERNPDEAAPMEACDVDEALEELLFRGGSLNRKLLGGATEVDGEAGCAVER